MWPISHERKRNSSLRYANHMMYIITEVGVVGCAVAQAPQCNDIDTSACQLMAASRPDVCQDMAIAEHACPRFCKLCRKLPYVH